MKRAQESAKGALWLILVLASRVYMGVMLGLVTWTMFPMLMGWQATVVMSGSMSPGINVGDIILAQPLTPEQVASKDFVVSGSVPLVRDPVRPDTLLTHRVIELLPTGGFVTKGDANPESDSTPVPANNIVGIERLLIPYLGIPVQALRVGNVLPAILFAAFTLAAQLIIMRDRRDMKMTDSGKGAPPKLPTAKRNRWRYSARKPVASSLAVVALIGFAATSSGSTAIFSGLSNNDISQFNAAASFPVPFGSRAVTLAGTSASAFSSNATLVTNPTVFTLEAWFKTTSTSGGAILGFANTASGSSSTRDRVLYLGNDGKIVFGVSGIGMDSVQTPLSYNDNKWHHVVISNDGTHGRSLYLDGTQVATDAKNHKTVTMSGYWRIGGIGGPLTGWADAPSNTNFAGSLNEVSIYSTVLSASRVAAHYSAYATPSTYQQQVLADAPTNYYRFEESAGPTAADSSGNGMSATYGTSGVTYAVPSN